MYSHCAHVRGCILRLAQRMGRSAQRRHHPAHPCPSRVRRVQQSAAVCQRCRADGAGVFCADHMCKSADQARGFTLLASAAFTTCPILCATAWALSIAAWRQGNVVHFIHLHFADAKCSLFQVYGNFPGDPMLEQHFDTANPDSIPCTVKRASIWLLFFQPQSVTLSSRCFQWLRNRASTRTPLQ